MRQPKRIATEINEIWSLVFVTDALFDGRLLRTLTVVDNYPREYLVIDVEQGLKGEHVARTLMRIIAMRWHRATIKVDNGSEFVSNVMVSWTYEHGGELDFSSARFARQARESASPDHSTTPEISTSDRD
ncbi:hypothetical protein WT83_17305 [Burkholderia territorii]|uniref:Integrase catalytic domain-containing protein n=1 Tax=Burkholderia territorii TaxID=1503055 RepID=A0A108EN89_9BURK|nr:DDE-type integrase/transposase/recombinase [Burkholderia territorii]KWN14217.1 hypothetical protein WT83_17305 [Burkholderia territorii]